MSEGAGHECGNLRPAICIGLEIGISRVAEEARNRNVGNSKLAEQPTVFRQLAFEIVERFRRILGQDLCNALLVARLAPHQRVNHLLIEQPPDEDVA